MHLWGASSRRSGSHPAQSRKRPRVSSPGAGEEDGDAASSVDAEILTSVRALGRYPIEYKDPKSEEELRERKLHRMIKYHSKKLSKETIAELEALRALAGAGCSVDAEILICGEHIHHINC